MIVIPCSICGGSTDSSCTCTQLGDGLNYIKIESTSEKLDKIISLLEQMNGNLIDVENEIMEQGRK